MQLVVQLPVGDDVWQRLSFDDSTPQPGKPADRDVVCFPLRPFDMARSYPEAVLLAMQYWEKIIADRKKAAPSKKTKNLSTKFDFRAVSAAAARPMGADTAGQDA